MRRESFGGRRLSPMVQRPGQFVTCEMALAAGMANRQEGGTSPVGVPLVNENASIPIILLLQPTARA